MKKLFFVMSICILGLLNVNAKEVYYTNGVVQLTEKEYNYVVDFYGKDYLEKMDREDYIWLADLDVNNREVEIKKADALFNDFNVALPNDTSVSSSNQNVAISAACASDFCVMTILGRWLASPATRSYDVIGARFWNTSLYTSTMATRVGTTEDGKSTIISNYQNFNDGFGNSVKLPDTGNNVYAEQRFYVNKTGGVVYGSYQHAIKKTTLAVSKNYYIDSVGYGNVFVFTGPAVGIYGGFAGVDITV